MENKKFSKEKMEEVFREIYKDGLGIEKCEWIEDGQLCHTWKVTTGRGTMYTTDAGIEQMNKAMKEEILKDYPDATKENPIQDQTETTE